MDKRLWGAAALAVVLAAGCDSGRHDTGREAGATAAAGNQKQQELPPRTGTIMIGDQSFHFDIGVCSIQQSPGPNRFMLTGRGETEEGHRFTVNADGSPESAAIVLRVRYGHNTPAKSYTARVDASQIRLDSRAISAAGTFSGVGEAPRDGRLSARCGNSQEQQRI